MADHSLDGAWDLIVTPWHLDEHLLAFPIPDTATPVSPPPLPEGPVPARMNRLHQAAAGVVAQAARPLVLSGDCPTARAAVAPMQGRYQDLAIVWLDAHGDFNTPAITTSGYIGGMALAMLTGRTPGLFDDPLGLRTTPRHQRRTGRCPRPRPRRARVPRRQPGPPGPSQSRCHHLHPRSARSRPGLPPPRHRRRRRLRATRRAVPLRSRTLPHRDRGMPGRRLRQRRRGSGLHRLRMAAGHHRRPACTRNNHAARESTRHRAGVGLTDNCRRREPDASWRPIRRAA